MNDRQKKLIKARKAARNREKPTEVKSPRLELKAQEKFTAEITQRLDTLCKLVGEQNHDAVIDRLAKLEVVSDQLNTLNSTINKLYGKKLQITNLKELAGHIKTEKVVIPDNKEFFNKFFEQMQGIEEKLKPNQDPTEFLPIRRVRKIGNRLQFDDDTWAGGGSSGVGALPAGDNTVGRVKLTDGTEVAEVNARADGKNALEVADDMTSFEAFTQALSASTDTTITFSQTVRLIRVKNNSTSAVVYVRDGAISSDTPANAELVGVAAAANLPNTEYYPFVGTTIHLRSAGTPTVSVTGFY